jgi:hypothetical protein
VKLETYLNAYGKASASQMDYTVCVDLVDRYPFKSNLQRFEKEYYIDRFMKRDRQAEKFKAKLLEVIEKVDKGYTICAFPVCPFTKDTNTADYKDMYEDDLYHYCGKCNSKLQIVRPGKWQCPKCN